MTLLAILAAALQPAAAVPLEARTTFVAMLDKARIDADCFGRRCPPMPIIRDPAEVPTDAYSETFRMSLMGFLLHVHLRKTEDLVLSEKDHSTFQVSLNVLDGYRTCLEKRFAAASDADYADTLAIDRIAARASDECKPQRESAMRRINFSGPDFATFDATSDGDKAKADVSKLLQKLQRFVVGYYAGLPRSTGAAGS